MLEVKNQKVIFPVDGLEDILTHISIDENEQSAIRVLCQDVVAQMIAKYPHLNVIVFIRWDMAFFAVDVNFKRFHQANEQTELEWSPNEALRLVIWLVSKADLRFYEDIHEIDQASQNVIGGALEELWGKELGETSSNEAYSSRWILAALSDFSGQLQARNIIRFLKYTSEPPTKKINYEDRVVMLPEIRAAASTYFAEEVEEVGQEYTTSKPILGKLKKLPLEHRVLPLLSEHVGLSGENELYVIREGYLERDGDKFYLPEITRHALRFKYRKGARPKVLVLTLKP